ncbi:MAG TPA: zinc-binding alcohol dehydrogenase family protein [Actinomycetales bacterium]|nr:zinc-binding alcohol dehydrogenase family protein [Actinomycetales bacterium]
MHAAPVVPLDLLCASGTSYFGAPAVPYVPGVQGVGVVEESSRFPAGTRVWFATSAGMAPGDGSLAERASVADDDLVPVTANVPDEALAALGLSAVAAWMALTWRGRLRPGERVLVLGGGGAVGQTAIGAAKALGAGRVVAVCRSEAARDRAQKAGADTVLPLVHDVEALAHSMQEAAGAVDLVVDPVFGAAATAASQVLAEGGRLINLGGASGDVAQFSSAVLRSRTAEVLGYTNNALSVEQRRQAIDAVAEHAAAGRLAVDHETLPLTDIHTGWRRQASGDAVVRLVFVP